MRESALQAAVAQYLAVALPQDAFSVHVPNEGRRGWQAQREFKRSGAKTGFPDLLIIWRGAAHLIELKAQKKYPSPEQRAVHALLNAAGATVHVCRSVAEVEMVLNVLGIPLHATCFPDDAPPRRIPIKNARAA